MRRGIVIVGSLLSIRSVGAQSAKDSAQCRALMLSIRDSIVDTIGVSVTPFDPSVALSAEYRDGLTQLLAQMLRVPNPLPVGVYAGKRLGDIQPDRDSGSIVPTIYGAYRMTVLRDGHAAATRVVGGARVQAFDQAVLTALRALSDSTMLPPFPKSAEGIDSIDLRLTIRPMDAWTYHSVADFIPLDMPQPLFAMRVPSLGRGQQVKASGGNHSPPYPAVAMARRIEGRTVFQFVVDADGVPDMSSIQVLEATIPEFVTSVLTALPRYRFRPLEVKGCHLASLVEQPFLFSMPAKPDTIPPAPPVLLSRPH